MESDCKIMQWDCKKRQFLCYQNFDGAFISKLFQKNKKSAMMVKGEKVDEFVYTAKIKGT